MFANLQYVSQYASLEKTSLTFSSQHDAVDNYVITSGFTRRIIMYGYISKCIWFL